MNPQPSEEAWRVRVVVPRLPWGNRPDRPADVGDELCAALLARENILEDANYQKITPNQFIVAIGDENYARNYHLLKDQILRQWNEKLLACLITANSRQGRQEYRFAGPLSIEIRPAADMGPSQIRIYSRVNTGNESISQAGIQAELAACLERLPDRRRWKLKNGILTIGRDPGCDIYLDNPAIQEKKLVSSQHAYLRCKAESYHLYDGSPDGKPSLNGTYVNLRRLPAGGVELKNGDTILLASLDVTRPNPDTHGVAAFHFYQNCP
jgi:hypothetical protein